MHESVRTVHQMSHLATLLYNPAFTFFRISLMPVAPAKPGVTKIFPQGGAILLPDSLFLYKPEQITRLLRWVRGCLLPTKAPRTWKVVTRPRLREWILNIVERRAKSYGNTEKRLSDPFMDIYQEISNILPLELMDSNDDFETPLESAPFVSPSLLSGYNLNAGIGEQLDKAVVVMNDELLVNWYANWSLGRLEHHRKFFIIFAGSKENGEVKKWGIPNRHVRGPLFAHPPFVINDALRLVLWILKGSLKYLMSSPGRTKKLRGSTRGSSSESSMLHKVSRGAAKALIIRHNECP